MGGWWLVAWKESPWGGRDAGCQAAGCQSTDWATWSLCPCPLEPPVLTGGGEPKAPTQVKVD